MAVLGRLDESDLVEGLSIWYLKASGLWRIFNEYRETGARSRLLQIWMVWSIVAYSPLFLASIIGPFFTDKDLEGMTLVILNPLTAFQMAIKLSVFWYGIETQTELLVLMKKNYLDCVPDDKKAGAEKILVKAVVKANVLAYMAIVVNAFTVVFWDILPILRSQYVRLSLGITTFGAPPPGRNKILGFWYPVDHEVTPWTQIVYLYEIFVCGWAGFIITLMEALIAQLVILLAAYIKIIQYIMINLTNTSTHRLDTQQLLVYIKEHQKLIRNGDKMRDLYNFVITMTLSTGLIILIIGIFNFILVTGKGDFIITLKFFVYTMYTLVEVCVYCYAGMELETTSEDVGFAAYSSDWYLMGPEFRKTLQMMMVRSRSPINLKAGQLYPVNFTTLTNILQMAYSTSMILFRITTKEDEEISATQIELAS